MTYLSGKSKKRKQYWVYGVYVVLFLAVVLMWSVIKKGSYTFFEPAVLGIGNAGQSFSVFPEFFHTYVVSHKSLVAREKDLEMEIERLENQVAEKDFLLRQYSLYQEVASSSKIHEKRPIVAYPIMKDRTSLYSTILLSKGFSEGIEVGDIVYVRGNQAVCSIKDVYASSSLCLLYTSSGVATEGVTSSSSITLSLIGRGGYYLADIVRDTPVTVGEKVLLRSNQEIILGTVKQVANNNQDTSWHVFVEGAYNPIKSSIFYVQP